MNLRNHKVHLLLTVKCRKVKTVSRIIMDGELLPKLLTKNQQSVVENNQNIRIKILTVSKTSNQYQVHIAVNFLEEIQLMELVKKMISNCQNCEDP